MSKKIVVTGVSGFIGRHVAEEARRRGYRVAGVDRHGSCPGWIEFTRADVRDRERMLEAMAGADCVVHLAAITANGEFLKDAADCYDINVNGFLSVIDAAAKRMCKRFVYASSAAVYRDRFSEDDLIDGGAQSNHYAKTKLINEMIARSYEDIHGMRTAGLRYFNVYGHGENEKGDYASIVSLFLKARRKGQTLEVYGDGTQARDLIDVRDAAAITLDALERGSDRIYNVGTGVATAYGAIARMINGEDVRFVPNPLVSYQHYTRAETRRMREIAGTRPLRQLAQGIAELGESLGPQ